MGNRGASRFGRLPAVKVGNITFPKNKVKVKGAPSKSALVPTFLAVAAVYNEIKILPYKLRWHEQNKIPLYLMDNYSTDGTWKWIQQNASRLAGFHRVDTDGAFDLRILQASAMRVIKERQPDWVIWTGADLFYQTDLPFNLFLIDIGSRRYNAASFTVINLNNTGETCADCNPFETYFYCEIGKPVTLAVKYHPRMDLFGDGFKFSNPKVYEAPGALFNFGFTKSRQEREETLARRQKAWERGMSSGQGRHYRKAAAHQWIWDADPKRDIRNSPYGIYYKMLQSAMKADEK